MKSYYLVARNTWDEAVSYRLNFMVWRLRVVLQLLTSYFLWVTILPTGRHFGGYNQSMMLTYILGAAILSAFVLATRTSAVAEEITQGTLSNYLTRPLNYFLYYFSKDLGDKAMNIAFSIVELSIIVLLLRPPFFIQTNGITLFLFFLSVALAIAMNFFINLILSFIGFWSNEVWAPRFIFYILITFFAGGLFPLDILPKPIYFIFQLLPFPYLLYAPMKIYLGGLSVNEIIFSLAVAFIWTIGTWLIAKIIWQKGLKLYGAEGK